MGEINMESVYRPYGYVRGRGLQLFLLDPAAASTDRNIYKNN